MNKDIWALWPDDFMCPKEEIECYAWRSDDYQLVEVLDYDEYYEPCVWQKLL